MPVDKPLDEVREKPFHIRMDLGLFKAASAKAGRYGLGAIIRAMLRAYIRGEIEIKPDDLLSELSRAPKRPRKPAKK